MEELRKIIKKIISESMYSIYEYADELNIKDYPKSKKGWRLDQLQALHKELPNMPNYIIMDIFAKSNERPYDKEEFEYLIKNWKDYKWELKKNFPISFDIFDKGTIERIEQREGGGRRIPTKFPMMPKDMNFKRKTFQRVCQQNQSYCSNLATSMSC